MAVACGIEACRVEQSANIILITRREIRGRANQDIFITGYVSEDA